MASASASVLLFRPFEAADQPAFRALNEAWIVKYFRLEPKDLETLDHPQHYILSKGGHIVIAERDGTAVGCCALIPLSEGGFEVAKMTVAESERGHGLGQQLLAHTIQLARDMRVKRLYLETNSILKSAIHLYEAAGFRHLPADRIKPSPYSRANVYMELFLPAAPETA